MTFTNGTKQANCIIVGLLLSMHIPLALVHLQRLWIWRPYYQFFPILLVGAACLFWRSRLTACGGEGIFRIVGLPVLVASLGLQLLAIAMYSPWLAAVSLLLDMAAIACLLLPRSELRTIAPVWMLLWLLIPLPFGLDRILVQQLQSTTSRLASTVLDFAGIPHLMAANLMELPGRNLFVDEACSGVNTVFAFVALAALYVCWTRRSWVIALPMMLSAIVWAALMNIVRAVLIVVVLEYWMIDLSEGWPHTALSFALLPTTLLLLSCTDRLLMFLFGPIRVDDPRNLPSVALLWNRLLGWNGTELYPRNNARDAATSTPTRHIADNGSSFKAPKWLPATSGLSVLLCRSQLAVLGQSAVSALPGHLEFQTLHEESIPKDFDGWTRMSFAEETRGSGNNFGARSLVWRYAIAGRGSAAISFDDWHELTQCYESIGWTVTRRKIIRSADTAETGSAVLVELEQPTGEYGILLFGLFDREGNSIEPPDALASKCLRRWKKFHVPSETYQLQLFLEIPRPMGSEQDQDVIVRYQQLKRLVKAARREMT